MIRGSWFVVRERRTTNHERRSGFTLVELLVTTSLMALVGAAAVAALAGGIRVWERAHETGLDHPACLIAFDRLRRDLHNTRRFKPVPFEGTYDQYAAAAVERADRDSTQPDEIGRLGYFLDERHHLLCRSFVPYRLVRRERLTDRCQAVLEDVTRIRFSYFGADEERGTTEWVEHWHATEPPLAVKCTLTIHRPHQEPVPQTLLVSLMNAPVPQDETNSSH